MKSRACIVLASAIACLLTTVAVPAAHGQCVGGTATAEFQTSGSFAGLYKYTIVISWDTPQGLSNVTMDCGFGQCPQQVCASTFVFESPAGISNGACTVRYEGEFNCLGNPSIGLTDPALKWDAVGDCEPGNMATAILCFYTTLGPQPGTSAPLFLIKNGQNVCSGTVVGDCPAPPCPVPTEDTSWGGVKARYR